MLFDDVNTFGHSVDSFHDVTHGFMKFMGVARNLRNMMTVKTSNLNSS